MNNMQAAMLKGSVDNARNTLNEYKAANPDA